MQTCNRAVNMTKRREMNLRWHRGLGEEKTFCKSARDSNHYTTAVAFDWLGSKRFTLIDCNTTGCNAF